MVPQSSDTLKAVLEAFNNHDLDAIMEFFADDCSFDMPRGPEPWGERFTGKAAVRQALATRFQGLQTCTTVTIDIGLAATWASLNGC